MKNIKLYNLIFPLWAVFYIPPILYFALAGNFIIDGMVIWVTLFVNKVKLERIRLFIKISQAWCFGLLVDLLGTSVISVLSIYLRIISEYNPWDNFLSAFLYILTVLICGLMIAVINYHLFQKEITDKKIRFRIAMAMGIITTPWTFLIPTTWFY